MNMNIAKGKKWRRVEEMKRKWTIDNEVRGICIASLRGTRGRSFVLILNITISRNYINRSSPYRAVNTICPVIKTSQLMLCREIIAVCSQMHTKHINTLCGQNVELLNVKLVVLYI